MTNEVLPGDVVLDRRTALPRLLQYAAMKLVDGLPPVGETPVADAAATLERARRDSAVSSAAYRLFAALHAQCDRSGSLSATMKEFAAMAGTSASGASERLDRLAALGFVHVRRQGPGRPIKVRLLSRQRAKSSL